MNFADKRILGRTGIEVSRLGLAGGYGVPAKAVEKAYHEFGINYFYWSTPRKPRMREGLRSLVKSDREKIVIVFQSYDHLGITVKRSVYKGLKTLGIDYVDVILLGWHNKMPAQKIIDNALELKEKGLVRAIAMSGHNRKFFGRLAGKVDSPIDIFMLRYNAVHRGAEEDIFPLLPDENRPGVTIYTATCWGKLLKSKKMPPGEKSLTASDCYRFVLSNPHVDLCMIGPRTEQEMIQGITTIEIGSLSAEEMARARKIGDHIHR
ncbi:MAG: aldo/keto reductase [candidate division Zixibacteria bacterium]|nr:aldo/keto reductase [candidate division Zixibacteria bacterium]